MMVMKTLLNLICFWRLSLVTLLQANIHWWSFSQGRDGVRPAVFGHEAEVTAWTSLPLHHRDREKETRNHPHSHSHPQTEWSCFHQTTEPQHCCEEPFSIAEAASTFQLLVWNGSEVVRIPTLLLHVWRFSIFRAEPSAARPSYVPFVLISGKVSSRN